MYNTDNEQKRKYFSLNLLSLLFPKIQLWLSELAIKLLLQLIITKEKCI